MAMWLDDLTHFLAKKLMFKAKGSVPMFIFFHLIFRSYDYNMHAECLLSANLCLVTLTSSEQCSKCETFRLQDVQMANKTSFKTKLIGGNADCRDEQS